MQGFLLGVLLAVGSALGLAAVRALRARAAEARALGDELRKVSGRLDSLEGELSRTSLRADVAETVLIEKGVADEEDLDEARRYFEQNGQPRYVRERDGNLH
ncbi:MAG TPA: hypothetical protein VMT17_19935 [Anaeromyxobacteraceae bacterium]|nr:hypothetical protein [Anaeromyxobacteraceae bacterium]